MAVHSLVAGFGLIFRSSIVLVEPDEIKEFWIMIGTK